MHTTLRILGWTVAVLLYGAAGLMLFGAGLFLFVPFFGWVLVPAALLIIIGINARLRRRRATVILLHVEQAVRLNMPLVHMLEAESVGEIGTLGRRLSNLASYLKQGYTVGNALEAGAPEVPVRLRDVIHEGERVGLLPQALAHAMAQRRAQDDAEPSSGAMLWGYPVAVLTTMCACIGFIFLFIIPKFVLIFEDFDTDMPELTITVIRFAQWLGGPIFGVLGADQYNEDQVVPGIVWLLLGLAVAGGFWLGVKVGVFRPMWEVVAWRLPWVRRRVLADACHVIEQGLWAGLPTDAAVAAAGRTRINAVLAPRLTRWSRLLAEGRPIGSAARKARLPGVWSEMTAAAEATGNLPDVFGFLKRHYAAGAEQWVAALRGAMVTGMILCLALIIGTIVVAMLLPLVELIWSVTPEVAGGGLMP